MTVNLTSLRVRRRGFGVGILVLVTLSSCAKKVIDDPRVLRMPLTGEPPSLDPQTADTGLSVFVLEQITSTLFNYDSERRIHPYDAESYEWADKGQELDVTLRKNLTWSDGQPLKACQYRDGILRALDPKTPSALAGILFEIKGAAEFKAMKIPASRVGVSCDDKNGKLKFSPVTTYSAKMLHALAFIVSAPIRKKEIELDGANWLLPKAGHRALGTGAFVIKEWAHDRRLTLEARDLTEKNLPEDRQAGVRLVDMPIVKDATTAYALYMNHEIDVLEEVPLAFLPKAADRPDKVTSPFLTTYMIGFSLKANPALKDKRVRQALAFAADQDEIPKILGGGEEPARGWIPPQLLKEEVRPKMSLFRPELARKLFRDAGFGGKKKFPTLKLFYNAGERHQILMERIAYNWKTQLGVEVELNPMEWKVLVATLKRKAPDLYRYAWAAVYPDPIFFLEIFLKDGANNFGGWANADYDRLVSKLDAVAVDKRDDAFWKDVETAQKILTQEDPALIPVYHYVRNALVSPSVKGFQLNWRGPAYLRMVHKEVPR